MSSPPSLEHIASGPSAEEAEEEELGMLSSSSSATITKRIPSNGKEGSSNTSAFARGSPHGRRDDRAVNGETDDEFAIDIAFVSTKGPKQRSNLGAFALPTASSSTSSSTQIHRQGTHGSGGFGASSQATFNVTTKASLASRYDSGEGETLNKYKGSDILDDTDRASDETEYQAWKARDARRRKDLLA